MVGMSARNLFPLAKRLTANVYTEIDGVNLLLDTTAGPDLLALVVGRVVRWCKPGETVKLICRIAEL